MINLFSIPPTDQSIYYLSIIFGPVGTVFGVSANLSGGGTVLGAMFQTFNAVVLVVGALIVVYVTVVGVVKTAHEGEFLGRHWNNLWTPLRMVVGIAALVPTPSGYSTIQIIMMWIIVQGIGAADSVWSTVLRYQTVAGSPFGPVTTPTVGIPNNMENLFQSIICQESAAVRQAPAGMTGSKGNYFCAANPGDPFCKISDDAGGLWNIITPSSIVSSDAASNPNIVYEMGPNKGSGGSCGRLTYCNPKNACQGVTPNSNQAQRIACAACTAGQQALQSIVIVYSQLGKAFAQADREFLSFLNTQSEAPSWIGNFCKAQGISNDNCCIKPRVPIPGIDEKVCSFDVSQYGPGDTTNASTSAVTGIYWPFLIRPSMVGNIDFITAAVGNYNSSVASASTSVIQQDVGRANVTDDALREAEQTGWLFAGAYYYQISRGVAQRITAAMPTLNAQGINPASDQDNALFIYRNNFDAAEGLLNAVSASTGGTGDSSADFNVTGSLPPKLSKLKKINSGLNAANKSMMNSFMHDLTGGARPDIRGNAPATIVTNPLSRLQNFGKNLLIVAQTFFALTMAIIIPLALIGNLDAYVAGTGFHNPVGPTLATLAIIFAPLLALFLGALFTFGGLLSVYVPLIPYVVFTMGAITWFVLVIEAMVAAPLLAIGILSPGEGHEILGKAHHALIIVFGLFLRPALMIFGLMAGMLLASVLVTMINAAFQGVMGQITSIGLGLVEMLLFMGAYVGLVLAALNKSFALIHIVPDRVTRWLGGHEGAGAADAETGLGGVKGAVGSAGAGVTAGAGSMRTRTEGIGGAVSKKVDEDKAAKKAGAENVQVSGEDKEKKK